MDFESGHTEVGSIDSVRSDVTVGLHKLVDIVRRIGRFGPRVVNPPKD